MTTFEQLVSDMETLAQRAEDAGFNIMATSLMLNVRCAKQFDRNVWNRLLTIAFTVLDLCERKRDDSGVPGVSGEMPNPRAAQRMRALWPLQTRILTAGTSARKTRSASGPPRS